MVIKANLKASLVILVLLAGTAPAIAVAGTIYVDPCATGANDGSSWGDAYNYLQDGLGDAIYGDEIWVADGNYYPDANTADPCGTGNREATFGLINGVAIYGGFAGGETSLDERDWQTNVTTLSGDINTPVVGTDNSYHVVTGSGTDANAVLDGFTITAGKADGSSPRDKGGGMYVDVNSCPTVTKCIFSSNYATDKGGGMYNYQGNPAVTNCTFTVNTAEELGGGFFLYGGGSQLTNCTFQGNRANAGGGMYSNASNTTLTNCIFTVNTAEDLGGGFFLYGGGSQLTNCTFEGNSASSSVSYSRGGGGMFNHQGYLTVTNCIFRGNAAAFEGGGMYNDSINQTLTNCIFIGNSAYDGGGIFNIGSSKVTNCTFRLNIAANVGGIFNNGIEMTIFNCIVWGNTDNGGMDESAQVYGGTSVIEFSCIQDMNLAAWGPGNIKSDPLFRDPNGPDGMAGTEDDNLRLMADSPCIDAGDNTAVPGYITTDLDGRPRFVDQLIIPNTGKGTPPIVDMGAYEYQPAATYVDVNTPDNNDGSSWGKAYKYLQDALADTNVSEDGIWVAEGIYKPDSNTADPCGTGNREATFGLINGVGIYGGFAGYLEPEPNARDIDLYETILSGDINAPGNSDNSYHVVTGSGTEPNAVLDGFTITGGNANGAWASSQSFGGGMYIYQGSPTIGYCTFSENSADYASGGMHNYTYSSPQISYCTFSGNTGTYSGAMQNRNYCDPTLTNCIFYGNTASDSGAISNHSNSSPRLVGCVFIGNSATGDGGAIRNTSNSNPVIINCSFSGNEATSGKGGGIFNDLSSPTLISCILWGDTASDGNEIALLNSSTIDVNYCDIKDGNDGIYNDGSCSISWGNDNIVAEPLFADADLRLSEGSPCIDDADDGPVESLMWDLDGRPRFADGDCNTTEIVDMGAYEFSWRYMGDFAGDCDVDFEDFDVLALTWLLEDGDVGYNFLCDISAAADDIIDEYDLKIFADNWLFGK